MRLLVIGRSHIADANHSSSWTPLDQLVEDWPLVVCDASSVAARDLIAVDHIRRNFNGEVYYPLYSSTYRWWYLSQQKKDEVLLIKMYDSLKAGGGGLFPFDTKSDAR